MPAAGRPDAAYDSLGRNTPLQQLVSCGFLSRRNQCMAPSDTVTTLKKFNPGMTATGEGT